MGSMDTAEALRAAARLRTALDMHDFGVAMERQRLRRLDPAAPDEEIERRLLRWLRDLPPDMDSP